MTSNGNILDQSSIRLEHSDRPMPKMVVNWLMEGDDGSRWRGREAY